MDKSLFVGAPEDNEQGLVALNIVRMYCEEEGMTSLAKAIRIFDNDKQDSRLRELGPHFVQNTPFM